MFRPARVTSSGSLVVVWAHKQHSSAACSLAASQIGFNSNRLTYRARSPFVLGRPRPLVAIDRANVQVASPRRLTAVAAVKKLLDRRPPTITKLADVRWPLATGGRLRKLARPQGSISAKPTRAQLCKVRTVHQNTSESRTQTHPKAALARVCALSLWFGCANSTVCPLLELSNKIQTKQTNSVD